MTLVEAFAGFVGRVPSREVALPGGRQRVWDFGTGRPVVLLHGIAGSRRGFFRVAPLLARTRRVIVPLLRGEDRPLAALAPGDLADDLAALFEALDLRDATLVGVSFGSLAAIAYAAGRDSRVREVVLQGGFARFTLRPFDRVAFALSACIPSSWGARYFAWRVLHGPEAALLRAHAPGLDVLVSDWSGKTPFRTLRRRVKLIAGCDLRGELERIAVPVRLARGALDRVVPRVFYEELCAARPDAARVEWPGVGHLAMLTHPEEFVRLVEE